MKKVLLILIFLIFLHVKIAYAQSNPVAYWKFDEGSGSTAIDSSSYGNDGALYGGLGTSGWTTSCKSGNCLNFDGVDDYVEIPHSNSISGFTNALTTSFWIRPDNVTRRQTMVNKYNSVNGQRGWFIEYNPSNVIGFFASSDGLTYSEWHAPFSLTAGTWYHIAVVWVKNGIPKFYVNGQSITTTGSSAISQIYNNTGTPLHIGKSTYQSGREVDGVIDEVRIYNRSLSEEEIKTLYLGLPEGETISINVTEEVVGTVPKLTWGANLWGNLDDNSLYDGLPTSDITLGRIDMDLNYIFPTNTSSPRFDRLDKMIDATKKVDIEPLLIVDYMPKWLSKNTSSAMHPPTNMTRFNELVAVVANHVKDNVTYYEVWNEPDMTSFWSGTETEYGDLLRNVAPTIRSIDSDAKILAPALAGVYPYENRMRLLQEVCTNANEHFDFVSFHLYVFPPDRWYSFMDTFKQKLNEFNCNKPLWFSEGGIWPQYLSWDNKDVMQVAKSRKILLDYNVDAQVYYSFKVYNDKEGTWHGIYTSSNKSFTPIGKYYQLAGQLKFYGEKLNTFSNIQNDVSAISFISVKNFNNDIIVQLTNSFSISKEVQINFQDIKGITVHESSPDQIFASPSYLDKNSSLNLTLKPYSVYLIVAKPFLKISGQLKNATNNPVQASVIIYDQGASNLNATGQTDIDGSYSLSVLNGTYDIQYNILNFFIPNFWIKLLSVDLTSNVQDFVNYITGYPSENKVYFTVNATGNQTVQTYSSDKPNKIKINDTYIQYDETLSSIPSWSYNVNGKIINIKFSC